MPSGNPNGPAIDEFLAGLPEIAPDSAGTFQRCDRDGECPRQGNDVARCNVTRHICETRCSLDNECPTAGNQPSRCEDGLCISVSISGQEQCTSRRVSETRELADISAAQGSSVNTSLWPGAIFQASAITEGRFVEVPVLRGPIELSTTLPVVGSSSAWLNTPSQRDYEAALQRWLANVIEAPAAQLSFSREFVRSDEQLSLAVGATIGTERGTIATSFDWSRRTVHSRTVVKSLQAYFSVDVLPLVHAHYAFSDATTRADVEAVTIGSPVYVGRITYGRETYVMFESEVEETEAGLGINLAVGQLDPSSVRCECVDANRDNTCDNCPDTDHDRICDRVYLNGTLVPSVPVMGAACAAYRKRELFEHSTIRGYVIGSREPLTSIHSEAELNAFLDRTRRFDPQNPGAPISYQLRFLADNAQAESSLSGSHSEQSCWRVGSEYLVRLVRMRMTHCDDGLFSHECNIYGDIRTESTAYNAAGTPTRVTNTLWSRAGSRNGTLDIREGDSVPSSAPTTTSSIAQVRTPHAQAIGAPLKITIELSEYDRHSADEHFDPVTLEWNAGEMLRGTRTVEIRGDDITMELTFVISPCTGTPPNQVCEALVP